MGNTCTKAQKVPSYDMTTPLTNQVPPQQGIPIAIPSQITYQNPAVNKKFRTLAKTPDLIKSRIKNLKKTKGFSQCGIVIRDRFFLGKFAAELPKQAQSAQTLTIRISHMDVGVRKKLSRFLAKMRHLNQVKKLTVSFESFSEQHFRRFCQNLQYMKSLTSLEIELKGHASRKSFFPILIPGIQSLKNLTQFSLKTTDSQIGDKFLVLFSRKLGYITPLKIVKLSLEHPIMLKCDSLVKILNNLRNLNLSTIILKIKTIRSEEKQLSEFLSAFKHFASSLENLILNLYLHGEWQQLSHITEEFKYLHDLKYLDLDFNLGLGHVGLPGGNKKSERAMKELVSALNLNDVPNKTHIKFEFSRDQFFIPDSKSALAFLQEIAASNFTLLTDITYNDQKSIHFAQKISLESAKNSLPKLPVLLNLRDIQEVPHFVAFINPLQRLYSLYLSINWNATFQLHETWLQQLIKNIAQLSSLSSLAFGFEKCHILEPVLFEKLCFYFSDLQLVSELSFDFTECIQITDACLASLGDMLVRMTRVKRLSLVFDECYLLQNEGLKALGSRLFTMKSLEYIKINCDGCFHMDPQEKGLLLDLANSVSQSEIRINKFLIT